MSTSMGTQRDDSRAKLAATYNSQYNLLYSQTHQQDYLMAMDQYYSVFEADQSHQLLPMALNSSTISSISSQRDVEAMFPIWPLFDASYVFGTKSNLALQSESSAHHGYYDEYSYARSLLQPQFFASNCALPCSTTSAVPPSQHPTKSNPRQYRNRLNSTCSSNSKTPGISKPRSALVLKNTRATSLRRLTPALVLQIPQSREEFSSCSQTDRLTPSQIMNIPGDFIDTNFTQGSRSVGVNAKQSARITPTDVFKKISTKLSLTSNSSTPKKLSQEEILTIVYNQIAKLGTISREKAQKISSLVHRINALKVKLGGGGL